MFEMFPCLPFQFVNLGGDEKLFYLLKIMRLYEGIQFIDISAIINFIGDYNTNYRLKKIIENNP